MASIMDVLNMVDNVKGKLTDGEYKNIVEALQSKYNAEETRWYKCTLIVPTVRNEASQCGNQIHSVLGTESRVVHTQMSPKDIKPYRETIDKRGCVKPVFLSNGDYWFSPTQSIAIEAEDYNQFVDVHLYRNVHSCICVKIEEC